MMRLLAGIFLGFMVFVSVSVCAMLIFGAVSSLL